MKDPMKMIDHGKMHHTSLTDILYGDSGKSKIENAIILYSLYIPRGEAYNAAARHGGGSNSGQDWEYNGRHIISHGFPPCADPSVFKMILAGEAVNPEQNKMMQEIRDLEAAGLTVDSRSYGISGRAQVTLFHHLLSEASQETGAGSYGTTKSGIGPVFMDAVGKKGITFAEFIGPNFRAWIEDHEGHIKKLIGRPCSILIDRILDNYEQARERLARLYKPEAEFWAEHGDGHILFCGHQGMGLDPWYGNMPFTSSAHQRLPDNATRVGITKLVPSSVGKRYFVTKMPGELADKMRGERGKVDAEFGKSTGRPRDIGYIDIPLLRENIRIARIGGLALTKFDCLRDYIKASGRDTVPVCVAYRFRGEDLAHIPDDRYIHAECKPVYEEWKISDQDLRPVRDFEDLDQTNKDFINRLCDKLECDWDILSVGPETEEMIINKNERTMPVTVA